MLRKFITSYGATILAICLVNLILYLSTVRLFFWADDFIQLKLIKDYSLADYFRAGILGDFANDSVMKYLYIGSIFRPVTHYIYWKLGWLMFNLNPAGYHSLNLIIHIANSLLVFWLSLLITRSKLASFIASILYASAVYIHINPLIRLFIINESVCVLFLLISFIFYILASSTRTTEAVRKSWPYIGLSIFSFGLALLSDERAIVLPVILILYDLFIENTHAASLIEFIKSKARKWAGYWFVSILYLLIRLPMIIRAITVPGGRYEFQLRSDILMKYFIGLKWTFFEYIRPIELIIEGIAPKFRFDRTVIWIVTIAILIILIFVLLKFGLKVVKNFSFRLTIFGVCMFLLFPAPIMLAEPFGAQYFTMGAIGLCIVAGYFAAMALERVMNRRNRSITLGILLVITVLGALRLARGYMNNPSGIPQRAIMSRQLIELLEAEQVDVSKYDAIFLTGFPEKLFANSLFIIESAAFELFLNHPAMVYQGKEIETQLTNCQNFLIVDYQRASPLYETTLPLGCKTSDP